MITPAALIRSARLAPLALVVTAVLANAPTIVKAQPTPAGPPPPIVVGSLGISDIGCDCTFVSGSDGRKRTFRFRSDPVVLGVRRDGPSYGALQRGDVIIDIDGVSLRTEEGSRRFANVRPGVETALGVRRDRRYMRVRIVPTRLTRVQALHRGEYSPRVMRPGDTYVDEDEWTPPPTPVAPRVPGAVRAPAPPVASTVPSPAAAARAMVTPPPRPSAVQAEAAAAAAVPSTPAPPGVPATPAPRGWFGFSIRCSDCGWSRSGSEDYPRWESETHPEVTRVAPDGPAASAGIHSGDLITHVDGISILTPEGGRKFGALKPGQRVRLGLLRDGTAITRELRLADRPGFASSTRPLRYTGKLRNVSVEVWSGAGTTAEQVGDTLIITIGNSVVRLKGVGKK